jgi:hypothetical protein
LNIRECGGKADDSGLYLRKRWKERLQSEKMDVIKACYRKTRENIRAGTAWLGDWFTRGGFITA